MENNTVNLNELTTEDNEKLHTFQSELIKAYEQLMVLGSQVKAVENHIQGIYAQRMEFIGKLNQEK